VTACSQDFAATGRTRCGGHGVHRDRLLPVSDRTLLARLTVHGAVRVPEITVYFWVIKALSTAMGEATSDYSVHAIDPVIAVILGFCGFLVSLSLQFWVRRYIAWTYWLAVVGVGVFGTMAADVLHVRFGVPYAVSTVLYGALLAAVFTTWERTEKTLSFHTIDTPRREAFYWAAVVATFAMGTAVGDLTSLCWISYSISTSNSGHTPEWTRTRAEAQRRTSAFRGGAAAASVLPLSRVSKLAKPLTGANRRQPQAPARGRFSTVPSA
jgi:hypothetical protein